jgi:hypothetical protein
MRELEDESKALWDGEIKRDISHKKKKKSRPFYIEHRYNRCVPPFSRFSTWFKISSYLTEKAAKDAMATFKKNKNHAWSYGFMGKKGTLTIKDCKQKSCPQEICRFQIYFGDIMDAEYRLVGEIIK